MHTLKCDDDKARPAIRCNNDDELQSTEG